MSETVTHPEFENAMTAIQKDFIRVDERFDSVETELALLRRTAERTLELVDSIHTQLKESRIIPARVERLERAVFK